MKTELGKHENRAHKYKKLSGTNYLSQYISRRNVVVGSDSKQLAISTKKSYREASI